MHVSGDSGLDGALDAVVNESRILVIEGPAGIGKTFHWSKVIESARRRGWQVLVARPSEAEARLVGSALIDLCDSIGDDVLETLPRVQQAALRAALLRGDTAVAADPHVVATAMVSLIRALAEATPLIIAIDDVQWLDAQTAALVTFLGRRLPNGGVCLLLTYRTSPGRTEPTLVTDVRSNEICLTHRVAELNDEEVQQLIRDTVSELPPGSRRRVVELSRGNPLYAIELARALVRGGDSSLAESLGTLVGQRLADLPEPTRQALSALAAIRQPTVHHLASLDLAGALAPAERAGLVAVDGAAATFLHPLYAAAAYEQLTGSEQQDLHHRLAEIVDGPEERARHLALGAVRPDAEVAAALEEAAVRALRRGASEAALEAARLGVRCTPSGDPAMVRRQIEVGRLLWRTNDLPAAADALRAVVAEVDDRESRAQAMLELADVEAARLGLAASWDIAVEANGCAVQPETRAKALLFMAWSGLDRDANQGYAEEAVRLFRAANADPAVIAEAESYVAQNAYMTGRDRDLEPVRRWVAIEEAAASPRVSEALGLLVDMSIRDDDLETARAALERLRVAAASVGMPDFTAEYFKLRFECELAEGRLGAAREHAETLLATAQESAMESDVFEAYRRLVRVCALLGDDEATERAAAGLQSAAANPDLARWLGYTWGTVAFVRGDYATAIAELSRGLEFMAEVKYRYPYPTAEPCLLAEALLVTGDGARAENVLAEYEEQARRWGQRRGIAAASRCRALLLAERGDASGAVAAADEAVAILETLNRPLDRALALLTKGQVHRRFKQKALAKDALTRAHDEFDRLGVRPYAERAQRELDRVGLRPPAPTHLTETERNVAELAAQGLNRADIAAALFISTHTVAANLTRIYRKLGVASRAELIAKLRSEEPSPP